MNQKRKRNCEMKQKEFQTDSIVIRVTLSFVFNSFLHQQVNTVHRWFKNHISNVPQIQYIQNHRLEGLWVIKLWQTIAYYLLYESFINFHSTFNCNIARSIFKLHCKIYLQNYFYTNFHSCKRQKIHKLHPCKTDPPRVLTELTYTKECHY